MKDLRKLFILFLVVLFAAVGAGVAFGQAPFPVKPVTIIVHAGAGGGSDIFARILSSAFDRDKILPQPIVVENKPGGSGGIAFAYVANKKKDPYFMVTAVTSFMTTPLMGLTPVGIKDFTPIANLAFDEYMLIVSANSRFKSMKDIVAEAKANPKKITVGGTQLGSSDSICTYLLEKEAGIKLNYIVFNSGGEVNAALLGGHVDLAIANPGEALELYKAAKVRILGVYAEKRLAGAPEVPTMKEQGINAVYDQPRGFWGPKNFPDYAVKFWEDAFGRLVKTKAFQEVLKSSSAAENFMRAAETKAFVTDYLRVLKVDVDELDVYKKK